MAETSTSLDTLIEAFKREVAIPGAFDDAYPTITDDNVIAALADAFAAAQLDGWFSTAALDVDAGTVEPALSVPAASLVVLYAGMRLIRTELRSLPTNTRYKAGSVEYEVTTSANVLTMLLKDLAERRDALIAQARSGATSTYVSDGYCGRLTQTAWGGFAVWEIPMLPVMAYGY